jgi:4-diphosphocytidyl-2-C-methyl-D-erythritol kinase
MSSIRVAAPAKLNLYLHVLGRRDDGYHLLDSLVAFASVFDTVTAAPSDGLSLLIDGPFCGPLSDDSDNLVIRAALTLADALGRSPDVRLTLTKRLPIASGIGGGSSDAAATLRALASIWQLAPADPLLLRVAAKLGADVPVCLHGISAYMGDIGDRMSPAPALPPVGLVLANPRIPLSTPAVFSARRGRFGIEDRLYPAPEDAFQLAAALTLRSNELSDAATKQVPEIGTILTALRASDGALLSRMSGSGATCFAIYTDQDRAERAAKVLQAAHPGWWVEAGRLVNDVRELDGA